MFIQLFNPSTYYRDVELASLKYHMYITCDPINTTGYIPDQHTPMNGDEFPSAEFDVRPINFNQTPNPDDSIKLYNRLHHNPKHTKLSKTQKHLAYQNDLFSCLEFEMSDSSCIDFKGKVSIINHHVHFTFYHDNYDEYSTKRAKQAKKMIKKYIQSDYFKHQNKLEKLSEIKTDLNVSKFNKLIYKAFSKHQIVDYKTLNKCFENAKHRRKTINKKRKQEKKPTPRHIDLSDDDLPF